MTIRDDVRKYFESEAGRFPDPPNLQARALDHAREHAVERRSLHWIAGAVATLLAVAIVAGLLAANSLRHMNVTPLPSNAPRVLFHDNPTAVATGRPMLRSPKGSLPMRYVLVATLPPTPPTGKVYAIDAALAPTPKAIALAFGINTPPRQVSSDEFDAGGPPPVLATSEYEAPAVRMASLQYFPATGTVLYGSPGWSPTGLRTSGNSSMVRAQPIIDETSAIVSAGDLLVALGMFSRGELATMPASAQLLSYPGNLPFWSIHFVRTLDAVPVDEYWAGAGASLQIQEAGTVQLLYVSRAPISGSEPASLIDAASAWRQITLGLGHAYALNGLANNGPVNLASFRADKAELCYFAAGNEAIPLWIIPMWCFRDMTARGPKDPIWLFYPAITPGTFDWTLPTVG